MAPIKAVACRGLAVAVALSALMLGLAGCTSPEGEADEPTRRQVQPAEDQRPDPAPKRGACYRLTPAEAVNATSQTASTPCTNKHTSRTIFVGSMKSALKKKNPLAPAGQAKIQLVCTRQAASFLAGDQEVRRLTRFIGIFFLPTDGQIDLGADWFRCDVIALGDSGNLLRLPAKVRLRGVLDTDAALDRFGLCGTAKPGTEGFARVACSLKHSWRAIGTQDLSGGRQWPGRQRLIDSGDDECAQAARAAQADATTFAYGWEWPTEQQWKAGQRYGYCWAPA